MSTDSVASLIERHRLLDEALTADRTGFLSDWHGHNPFAAGYLGPNLSNILPEGAASRYAYFDDSREELVGSIRRFHGQREHLLVSDDGVLLGAGSSTLLATICIWLAQQKQEIVYVPPLYHSVRYLLRTLDVHVRPASDAFLFDESVLLRLPNRRAILLITDPIWFAGRCVPESHWEEIAQWQARTGSIVFVDGSFQFMRWDPSVKAERSAILDPALTLRLISPAKALAIPAFRYAYLLHPGALHNELSFTYETIVGSTSALNVSFAVRAMQVLGSPEGNRELTDFLAGIFRKLVSNGRFERVVDPECGYFVFAQLRAPASGGPLMDQDYFELTGYEGFSRINLMIANRHLE